MPKTLKTLLMKTTHTPDKNIQWHLVDAQGQVLGRLAGKIAYILRGKHKVNWSPHIDAGDFVVLINADQIHLSGRKWVQKSYYSHSRHIGSLKEKQASLMAPESMIREAVQGMLPKNKTRKKLLKKLKIYVKDQHPHQAQKPTPLNF